MGHHVIAPARNNVDAIVSRLVDVEEQMRALMKQLAGLKAAVGSLKQAFTVAAVQEKPQGHHVSLPGQDITTHHQGTKADQQLTKGGACSVCPPVSLKARLLIHTGGYYDACFSVLVLCRAGEHLIAAVACRVSTPSQTIWHQPAPRGQRHPPCCNVPSQLSGQHCWGPARLRLPHKKLHVA